MEPGDNLFSGVFVRGIGKLNVLLNQFRVVFGKKQVGDIFGGALPLNFSIQVCYVLPKRSYQFMVSVFLLEQ